MSAMPKVISNTDAFCIYSHFCLKEAISVNESDIERREISLKIEGLPIDGMLCQSNGRRNADDIEHLNCSRLILE